METEPQPKSIVINEMPSKEVLERYLEGGSGRVTVYFDLEKGIFVDMEQQNAEI
jgi:hypothetical protein